MEFSENDYSHLTQYPDLAEEFIDLSPREMLEEFIESRKGSINILRSYLSHEARRSLSEDLRAEMALEITDKSRGALSATQGLLCEISEDGTDWEKEHSGKLFKQDEQGHISAVKGFYFTFYPHQTAFECFVLDTGRSRETYDKKTPEEKRKFLENFAANRNRRFDPVSYPFGYSAVLEQDENKAFHILDMVSHPKPKI